MTTLFTREGQPPVGVVRQDSKGKPYYAYISACFRCGGAGGYTGWPGFTCYRCGGSGKEYEPTIVKLYTAEQLVKMNASKAKRDEKKAAAQAELYRAQQLARVAFIATLPAGVREMVEWFGGGERTLEELEAQERTYGSVPMDIARNVFNSVRASDRQLEVLEQTIARIAARKAERAALVAGSSHVGTVGERIELVLTVDKVLSYSFGQWPTITTYINLCKDQAGNMVVYKGSNAWEQGETIKVKATVKEHGERDGVKQTIIQRPKVLA